MKRLIFILLVCISGAVIGQPMQATQVETSIDFKFKIIQKYLDEAKDQVRSIMANEAIQGNTKNRELTRQLLADLQAVMKLNRPKFMEAKETIWRGDSLQTVQEKANLTTEINRLKAEIIAGEDSTLIQPKINELTNKRNEINKIMRSWVKVTQ